MVCRFVGTPRRMRSTCGLKPMSSIRSASSSTSTRTSPSLTARARSGRRDVRAWRRGCGPCAPGRSGGRSARRRRRSTTFSPFAAASGSMSAATWSASSRVGTRTSAPGERVAATAVRSTSGSPKASVLPEPVGDSARMSRPARASGRTRFWMAKGCVIPCVVSSVGDRRADAELLKGLGHCSTPSVLVERDATSSNNPRKRRNEEPDLHEAGWHS